MAPKLDPIMSSTSLPDTPLLLLLLLLLLRMASCWQL
jgi:hypothetical protein